MIDPTIPVPLGDSPLVSNGSGVSYTTTPPIVNPVDDPTQEQRVLPRNIVPGSFQGTGVYNFGGINGLYLDGSKGLYAGNIDMASASFSVDFEGKVIAESITIKDATGSIVIDSGGLNSLTNFANGNTTIIPTPASTDTTDFSAIVTGLTITFTLTRTANVYIFANTTGGSGGAGTTNQFAIFQMGVDGSATGSQSRVVGHIYQTSSPFSYANQAFIYNESVNLSNIVQLASGSHTIDVRYATSTSGVGAMANSGNYSSTIGYIVLGS